MVDPARWLAEYDERLTRVAAGAEAATERLRTAGGRATSPRGEVTVTVNAGGALDGVTLTPAARTLEADQLARLIVTTARQAQQEASTQVADIMTRYLGDGAALDQITRHQEVGR
jgi:fructose-1,6-bisphosphatase/sedoheptulose 1,7-bisphosphatase-like protein